MNCKLFIFIFCYVFCFFISGFDNFIFKSTENSGVKTDGFESNFGKSYKVELKDPKSALTEAYGQNFTIMKFESEPFNSTGDYYRSSIKEVKIIIEEKDGNKKELNLIAKMFPPTDFQREIALSLFTFKKEIFFYKELIPAYEKTLRNSNLKNQTFHFVPKLYGSRLTLKPDFDGVDEDAAILMENLKTRGYYTEDKNKGN